MTRQAIEQLIDRFGKESDNRVHHRHAWYDSIAGRMICEWEATDRQTLLEWLQQRHVQPRGEHEWVMQIQLEAENGHVITEG